MSLIKLVASGIELDFVKETLSIRKENNAMIRNFKVAHSNFPFLIVENKKTIDALGPQDLTSISKVKTIVIDVYENDLKYYGELQILSYLNGFRKCNLKYASPLLEIMNQKISEFMPVVSVVTGNTTANNFTEESETFFTGDASWPAYVENIITKGFPEVKWNFPMMQWKDKFGTDLTTDDEWYLYKNFVNAFDNEGNYILNTAVQEEDFNFTITNIQVPMPQVYLLAPLFYALQSLGFTYQGSFVESVFIKKILMLSTKNNLCKILPLLPEEEITLPNLIPWINPVYKISTYAFQANTVGSYFVKYRFVEPQYTMPANTFKSFKVSFDGASAGYLHQRGQVSKIYEETIEITVNESQLGKNITFTYLTPSNVMPTYEISVTLQTQNAFYQMHPTIPIGRYCPDWTFATYLNNIKNWFNLNIDVDDLRNKLLLNFNEDWIINQLPTVLNKSMLVKSYEPNIYQAFLLKHDNDEDVALWIDAQGANIYTTQKSKNTETLDGKFKFVPTLSGTSILSESLDDKSGVGLMIYDESLFPNTTDTYDGKTLKIEGPGGIYDSFWKVFLKFRLNASLLELSGGFTKTEIGKILKTNRIYVNNQDFVVTFLEYKELKQDNYTVTFKVESFTI